MPILYGIFFPPECGRMQFLKTSHIIYHSIGYICVYSEGDAGYACVQCAGSGRDENVLLILNGKRYGYRITSGIKFFDYRYFYFFLTPKSNVLTVYRP